MSQVYKAIEPDGEAPSSAPQGFLDYEGVKHLWSKVSMKDYPNNETLAAVINAIDETKADKSELFSGSWNDLSDRPFSAEQLNGNYIYNSYDEEEFDVQHSGQITMYSSVNFDKTYLIRVDGGNYLQGMFHPFTVQFTIRFGNDYAESISGQEGANIFICQSGENTYTVEFGDDNAHTLQIFEISDDGEDIVTIYNKISDEYISATIARVEDIVTPVQSNWLENSSESISYIQNKPFYEETKYLLQRTIFNCSEIHSDYYPYYTDKNNCIYTALKVGKTYGVSYLKDFGEYKDWSWIELIAQDVGGNIAIGNLSIMNNDNHNYENTGEEFMILWLINHDYGIICTKEPKEIEIHEISTNELKQLDDKFIPNTIARVSDIPEINYPVTSINNQTGDITLDIPVVYDWAKASIKPAYTAEEVGADPEGSALESLVEAKSYADTAVAALVNSAPETLDTLGELATAFEENADMVATLDAAVTNKAEKSDLDNLAELVDLNATNIESLQAQVLPTSLILADAITGVSYTIQIQNGQLVSFETTT